MCVMPCSRDCILLHSLHICKDTSDEEAFLAFLANKHDEHAAFTKDHLIYFREELSKIITKLDYYETAYEMQQLGVHEKNEYSEEPESNSRPPSSILLEEEIHIPISPSPNCSTNGVTVEQVYNSMCNTSQGKKSCENYSLPEDEDDGRIVFNDFVSQSNPFLCLRRVPTNDELLEDVNGPLGVCYDEVAKQWIIADTKNTRILLYPSCQDIGTHQIKAPTAVCVLQPGVSFAILTFSCVAVFSYTTRSFSVILDEDGLNCRGLALTPNGNLVTIRKFADSIFLTVFSSVEPNKQFGLYPLEGNNASFLHMIGNTLLITDLGNQSVTKIYLNDNDEKNIIFEEEAKHDGFKWNGETNEPNGKFNFVSGVQIDGHGWSLIGDAGGHTIQLFDNELNPMYRVSANFPLPYMSAFAVNNSGEVMICGRQTRQLYLARLCAIPSILPRLEKVNFRPSSRGAPRGGNRGSGRGGRGRGYR